ncbi:hypothetical protein [Chryseobacterium sp. GP-SGM7]|uniref:hypothetical protein n=1 Tax=Chryseobacterium sp. GP-SGM7 TaxID=3411323 RepID=UPI003B93B8A0
MRKIYIYQSLFLGIFNFAQNYTPNGYQSSYSSTLSVNSLGGDHAVFGVKSENSGKSLKYDEIIGSPYLDKGFRDATVAKDYEKTAVRYNSYLDEIEFQKDGKPLVLPKEVKFYRIELYSPKETIVFLETNDNLKGYFFEIVNHNNISLYKKIRTKFIDAIPAANSYASDKAASFKLLDPVYYLKTEKGFIKNPRNKKEIIDQFPEKKDSLEVFFKENKIKFDKEEDLKKLVTFLNQ